MSEKELLNDWLLILYKKLEKNQKEISELEVNMNRSNKLAELQLIRINKWLNDEKLDPDLREEFEYTKGFVGKLPEENREKLKFLKTDIKSVEFMIIELEKELGI